MGYAVAELLDISNDIVLGGGIHHNREKQTILTNGLNLMVFTLLLKY